MTDADQTAPTGIRHLPATVPEAGPQSTTVPTAVIEAVRRVAPAGALRSVDTVSQGYMHSTHIVSVGEERVVVKVLNCEHADAGLMMPIDQMVAANRAAGEIGVGPRVLDFDPEGPTLVLGALEGQPLSPEEARESATLSELAALLARLHCSPALEHRLDPFAWLKRFAGMAHDLGSPPPERFRDAVAELHGFGHHLNGHPQTLVPCHNDLLAANVLATPDGVRLVDFDFAGMNEPAFELGDVVAENGLTAEQTAELSAAYLGRVDGRFNNRVRAMSIVALGLWGYCAWLAGARAGTDSERQRHVDAWAAKSGQLEAELADPGLGTVLGSV